LAIKDVAPQVRSELTNIELTPWPDSPRAALPRGTS
jgi:hypothetical protein